ncbi:MAG TPA: ATP-binding protein [Pseudomonadales bacterium]|nr:ATP-binding protein [Pseudomonadales bacterium]
MASSRSDLSVRVAPWLLAFILAAGMLLFLDQARRALRAQHLADVEVAAEQIGAGLALWLEHRLAVIEQFANQLAADVDSVERFDRDVATLFSRVAGFRAINWIDVEGVIRRVEPESSNRQALGRDLTRNPSPRVREAVERALSRRLPSRTLHISFYQGGSGFSVYWPVVADDGELRGLVNGVFDLEALLMGGLSGPRLGERFAIALQEADDVVVHASDDAPAESGGVSVVQRLPFVDAPLQILVETRAPLRGPLFGATYVLLIAAILGLAAGSGFALWHTLDRQRERERREAHVRLLMNSTQEGLIGADLEGRCTFANAAARAQLGIDDGAELVGASAFGWLESDPAVAASLAGAIANGESWYRPAAPARRRDGSHFVATVRLHPVREGGVVTGGLLSFADVSAEIAEAEQVSRLTEILQQVPDMVLLGDPEGRLLYLNPAGRRLLAIGDGPVSGIDVGQFMSAGDNRLMDEVVTPWVARHGAWEGTIEVRSLDGSSFPARAVVMGHPRRVGAAFFSAVVHDLRPARAAEAERELLQEQFHQAQRLESLGVLAGGVAHDFNNLLVSILGNATQALDLLPADAAARPFVRRVTTATERAADLTAQLLAYSGRGRFELRPTDLTALVEEMADLLRTTVARSAHFEVSCAPTQAVVADATQVRQLVLNLITNAVDAVGELGRVRVSIFPSRLDGARLTGRVFGPPEGERAAAGERDWVVIEVTDDGPGMSEAVGERIFDPFYSTKEHGKGLGLAAVLGIVRGHEGLLQLESAEGAGTVFRVLLPPVADAAVADTAAPEVTGGHLGGTVLLVDDEPSVRGYLRSALETIGFTVVDVDSGEEAVAVFGERHGEFALVLIDQTMSGISGSTAWQQMRAITAEVPGVLMSGFDEERIEGSLEALGFSGFLQKPFRFAALRTALERAMGGVATSGR